MQPCSPLGRATGVTPAFILNTAMALRRQFAKPVAVVLMELIYVTHRRGDKLFHE